MPKQERKNSNKKGNLENSNLISNKVINCTPKISKDLIKEMPGIK
jgi:hypothetical protein